MPRPKSRTELLIPNELYDELRVEAERQERPIAQVARYAIRQYLDQQRARHEAPSSKE